MGNNSSGYSEITPLECCKEADEELEVVYNSLRAHKWVLVMENHQHFPEDPNQVTMIKELQKHKLGRLLSFTECHAILGHDICMEYWHRCRDYRALLFLNLLTCLTFNKPLDLQFTYDHKHLSIKIHHSYRENFTHNYSLRMELYLFTSHNYVPVSLTGISSF